MGTGPLTAEMREENEGTRQTMWVALGETPLRFRKLYVPGVPRGSVFGLFRTVEGRAFLAIRAEPVPSLDVFEAVNAVKVNGRTFDAYISLDAADEDKAIAGLLLDEKGRAYTLVRSSLYDKPIGGATCKQHTPR